MMQYKGYSGRVEYGSRRECRKQRGSTLDNSHNDLLVAAHARSIDLIM